MQITNATAASMILMLSCEFIFFLTVLFFFMGRLIETPTDASHTRLSTCSSLKWTIMNNGSIKKSASPRTARETMIFLREKFPNRLISRFGPTTLHFILRTFPPQTTDSETYLQMEFICPNSRSIQTLIMNTEHEIAMITCSRTQDMLISVMGNLTKHIAVRPMAAMKDVIRAYFINHIKIFTKLKSNQNSFMKSPR